MCNGYNHARDCACGFGPPYPGRITAVERVDWSDAAARDPVRVAQALRTLGVGEESVEAHLAAYRAASAAGRTDEAQSAIARRWLADFLKRRKFEVVASEEYTMHVPLFKLHSPAVRGSRVTYRESETSTRGAGWSVTMFGTGLGADHRLEVQYSATFRSEGGGYELVFFPLEVRVDRVVVYERNEPCYEGYQTEALLSPTSHLNKALKTLESPELESDTGRTAPEVERYLLSGSTSSSVTAEWHWTNLNGFKLQIGVRAAGVDASIPVSVQRTREFALTCDLPCGHDYTLSTLRDEHGIIWSVDDQPPRTRHDAVTSVRTA